MSRIRIVPTLVVIVVSLLILFGGWAIYRNFGLEHPTEQALVKIQSVQNADVLVSNQVRVVKITVKNVKDLQTTYHKIKQVVAQSLGSDTQIQVIDNRTDALTNLYQTLQPALYEGIHKGNYTEMIQSITNNVQKSGATAKVTMDSKYIYIQLVQGNHQLDDIISYASQQQEVNPS